MKVALIALFVTTASAFSPQQAGRTCTSSLNLFGSGGEKKGPNMMDQLAMFVRTLCVYMVHSFLSPLTNPIDYRKKPKRLPKKRVNSTKS